ncbi:MAG: hypothetical protein ACE5DI_00250 [Candidatus Micrarchaeia archaeon]
MPKLKFGNLVSSRRKTEKHLPHVHLKEKAPSVKARQITTRKHHGLWLKIADSAVKIHHHARNALGAIKKHKQVKHEQKLQQVIAQTENIKKHVDKIQSLNPKTNKPILKKTA